MIDQRLMIRRLSEKWRGSVGRLARVGLALSF